MKRWYRSKTLWVNGLTLAAMILATVAAWPELNDASAEIAYALAIVNVILRFLTSEKLG